MKNKSILIRTACIFMSVIFVLQLSGCFLLNKKEKDFNAETESVVYIKTMYNPLSNSKTKINNYYAVSDNGTTKEIEKFEPDEMEITDITERQYNKHFNEDDIFDRIMLDLKLKERHDYFCITVFNYKDMYFLYTEMNVNLLLPCDLYYYDKDNLELKQICELNRERVVGIKIKNPDLFKTVISDKN